MKLTKEYVNSLFDYDPDTGILTWKYREDVKQIGNWNARFAGKSAGYIDTSDGLPRKRTVINGIGYYNSNIIWLWYYGSLPLEIDHEDGDALNDRIRNLRAVTHIQNSMNKKKYKNNSSGIKGVKWHKASNKWMAVISVNRREIYLGIFNTIEEASIVRKQAEIQYYGEYVRKTNDCSTQGSY